jgi:hypothetical protein
VAELALRHFFSEVSAASDLGRVGEYGRHKDEGGEQTCELHTVYGRTLDGALQWPGERCGTPLIERLRLR